LGQHITLKYVQADSFRTQFDRDLAVACPWPPEETALNSVKGGISMVFGIEDPQIILAYVLAIGVTIVCVVYGWLKWNKEEE
jgi:hypothetical protein